MNIEKLKTLRDFLKAGESLSIPFHTLYGGDFKVLGLDEFPHDREFVQGVFGLTDRDFDFLFVPASIKIETCGEYVALLSSFIHLKEE